MNCANNNSSYTVGGVEHLTTWAAGPANADDNLWRVEPVDVENMSIYEVTIEGEPDIYVKYDNGTTIQKAFNGGFFITPNVIAEDQLSLSSLSNNLEEGLSIVVKDNAIIVSSSTTNIAKYEFATSDTTYDLHGRRVQNPTKGVYIVNGKKALK